MMTRRTTTPATPAAGRDRDPDDPTLIDWPARQKAALVPFQVIDGRPLTPGPRTGRTGRGTLWHWGERPCADAAVIASDRRGRRWLLMIERGDGLGWALPGGGIDPGETPAAAAGRELAEETGLRLPDAQWTALPPCVVANDPRGTDEAWPSTVVHVTHLTVRYRAELPAVQGGSDATRAAWVRADSIDYLAADLRITYSGTAAAGARLFSGHADLLADLLGRED
ncbi:NUDIX domain-containing protein [Spongiactinospora sp. 9N601]|uniref:NUDIX domain-containing protein n=1 Tax=Spongiactinospora sp. 9N601 TaxID=3375149 RepID=UPI0037A5277A